MGWKTIFGKKKARQQTPAGRDNLSDLRKGDVIDYDLISWQVSAYNRYDWGDNDTTYEWQLKSHNDVIYLEREPGDEDYWCISRKIPFSELDGAIRQHILEHGDPPGRITFQKVQYHLDESCAGHFYQDGREPGRPVLKWEYATHDGSALLTIEQWGENEFEAAVGEPAAEYQFTNMLPGPGESNQTD